MDITELKVVDACQAQNFYGSEIIIEGKVVNSYCSNIDTIFLNTSLKYAYLSSSIVKEMAMYGGDISKFVPSCIIETVRERYSISYKDK